MEKWPFKMIFLASVLMFSMAMAFPGLVKAETTYTFLHGGTLNSSESTDLTALGKSLSNGDVVTIYAPSVTASGQFSGNGVGEAGTATIQSATPGTQVSISTNNQRRFCDFAHGTYVLKDLHFNKCGILSDGGGVFYRNDLSSSVFKGDNILVENCLANQASAFRTAKNMTISGTFTFKNNACSLSNGAVLCAASGVVLFTGDSSVMDFTGSVYRNGSTDSLGWDVYASSGIEFSGTGTYTFGSGLNAPTLKVRGSNVTLNAGSRSTFSGATTIESGTLNLASASFTTTGFTVQSAGKLKLSAADMSLSVANAGSIILNADRTTIVNLVSNNDETSASITVDPSFTSAATLTLENTEDSQYYGSVNVGTGTFIKTGGYTLKLTQTPVAGSTYVRDGMLSIGTGTSTITPLGGSVFVDGGTLRFDLSTSGGNAASMLADGSKLFVTAAGGTLKMDTYRGYILNGIHSASGVDSGVLKLNGVRAFITGVSTFNGYFELTGGVTHFSNEAVASSKGIILNGGRLQYLGETKGTSGITKTLSAPIFLKGSSAINCGWGGSFTLTGDITDWAGVDMSGKTLSIVKDSGTVNLNGSVNTKAGFAVNEAVATNGAKNLTFGGLSGSDATKTFSNNIAAANDKMLTLDVANGRSYTYSAGLTGLFNLVKDGEGTQVFATTGVGSSAKPLNSVTVSEGTLSMTKGASIYSNSLTVQENGTLLYGTGAYTVDVKNLDVQGDVMLTFASDTEYTTLNFSSTPTLSEEMDGIFDFITTNNYEMKRDTVYNIGTLNDLGADFNYDSLLKGDLAYVWNLTNNGGSLLLQMDNNAVPEPAGLGLLILGALGIGMAGRKRLGKKESQQLCVG